MKTKYFLLFFLLWLSLSVMGALFKIMHWQGADELLMSGMAGSVLGALGLFVKLLFHPRVKDFLNH
ncbi:hypothetical protein SAMN06265337_0518 [Hymenobacter gelipurpurascens]|uniref:Gliding motility protein GldL-like N-terminal domain-containing protein n=1 Tax=Hymenobacter gelipurpurascens TaxID=89968 RepID=A0A212T7C6_9BACT|nr:hypothetical protein [Hymenobacter gelipurpurascens]SNC61684.1 hypothetical protein SAMN06265337_0518 [Hymenobacter gelipurpurascens]